MITMPIIIAGSGLGFSFGLGFGFSFGLGYIIVIATPGSSFGFS